MSIALRDGRRTLAEELRLQLADEIVRGTLTPGATLDEMVLARRFRVSRRPVRAHITTVREAYEVYAAGTLACAR